MKKLIILLVFFSCSKSEDPQPKSKALDKPIVSDLIVQDITGTTAHAFAKVSGVVTDKGFIYKLVSETKWDTAYCKGPFDAVIGSLVVDNSYQVKAWAKNQSGYVETPIWTFYVMCPSDLSGTANYSTVVTNTSGSACPVPVVGQVTFKFKSLGVYTISDISFGLYACAWSDTPAMGISLKDTCHKISLSGTDQYGLVYTWVIVSNNGTNLVIQWHNDYGDAGITTLTRTGGWPLDLNI